MAEETKVVSPGEVPTGATPEDELDVARRRLIELAGTLSEHFDRALWLEYLRLRRAETRRQEIARRVY